MAFVTFACNDGRWIFLHLVLSLTSDDDDEGSRKMQELIERDESGICYLWLQEWQVDISAFGLQ